jgi:UDP-2,3-diacylglucosamine pyrophosphatase LpxH
VAGVGVYRGQENELAKWTFEDQKEDVVKNYPNIENAKTYYILGNHDNSFLKAIGADIGVAISKSRKDLVYTGQVEADIKLARKVLLRLRHPDGGSAYALSYPMQRYIASLEGGQKPNILAQGHYHTAFYMDYRNIHALSVPCFERQSLFLKAKGLQPTCGAWLVEMNIKDGSIIRFQPELIKFF